MVVCLRTDRGGEYNSKAFQEFCVESGIKRQLTAAYTPQQNGIAERKNRSIMNMVRCMLFGMKVPLRFWTEATQYAVHILNQSPTAILGEVTPSEKWSNHKPSVEHLRVFGCLAYAMVPYDKRTKLEEKSIMCVMFGVSKESKAYRLYDPTTKKIIISKDVKFDEGKSWNWEEEIEDGEVLRDVTDVEEETQAEDREEPQETQPDTGETQGDQEDAGTDQADEGEAAGADRGSTHAEETTNEEVQPRLSGGSGTNRAGRNTQKPTWMKDYVCEGLSMIIEEEEEENEFMVLFVGDDDPETFEEAVRHENWRLAMDVEIKSIIENNTWELVDLPDGAKVIGVKWVFKTKFNEKGAIDKFKARLVAKGFHQTHGVDFHEIFAPVARWDTIRLILGLAAQQGWNVLQLDVKSAFLHGELSEDVYVEQPKGFESRDEEGKVYKLNKALYGLRQAPRAWYSRIEGYFIKEGFRKCYCEHTLFVKTEKEGILIISLYVDDLIYTSNSDALLRGLRTPWKKSLP